jgi:hypothetical protein
MICGVAAAAREPPGRVLAALTLSAMRHAQPLAAAYARASLGKAKAAGDWWLLHPLTHFT